ncbi:PLP-dependent transferase [Flagelloscypha sp. PMI_526]|nr:PLP-dependent transferase [Flagelloscypha sp. PMI_526]
MAQLSSLPTLAKRAEGMAATFGASQWPRPSPNYDPITNPDGLIAGLTVAENNLLGHELVQYINAHFRITTDHLKYRPALINSSKLNITTSIPKFFNRSLKPLTPILIEHVISGPGVGAMLSHLLWAICDPGDGVLLTCPYYADYPKNLFWPAETTVVPVIPPPEVDSLSMDIVPYIQETIRKNSNVKVLILVNPHNPLAKAYPEETIRAYASIAEEFNLYLITDEVFANEVFPSKYSPNPQPFRSILSLSDLPCNPGRIFVIAGPTKDLGASGIKLGCLIAQRNQPVLDAVAAAVPVTPLSTASDAIFTHIIEDEEWLDGFLDRNRKALAQSFELLARWCEGHGFEFCVAEAGIFALVDFAPLVNKIDGEMSTLEKLDQVIERAKKAGVMLRTSAASEDPVQTRMRIVFTSPAATMKVRLLDHHS